MSKKLRSVLALALVLCFTVLAVASSGDDDPEKVDGTTGSNGSQGAEELTFKLGEVAQFKALSVTANKIVESDGSEYNEPADGKVFVGVEFTVSNTSNEDQTISSLLLFDAYVDDTATDLSFTAAVEFDDGTLDGTLAAGKKMTGYYAIECPENWEAVEIQMKSGWLSSGKAIFKLTKSDVK